MATYCYLTGIVLTKVLYMQEYSHTIAKKCFYEMKMEDIFEISTLESNDIIFSYVKNVKGIHI